MTARWTVITVDENTGQVIADHVAAATEWEAFEEAGLLHDAQGESIANLTLVAAILGELQVATPTESGNACSMIDYPIPGITA